jgi:hypothetical protein
MLFGMDSHDYPRYFNSIAANFIGGDNHDFLSTVPIGYNGR